ncbi:hypothetical protein B0H19DRAFT_1060324 [Mycena capillaripes]|nr:hypothetical protein B0H19DRAFT_1060324 [Mycena capillaripes]
MAPQASLDVRLANINLCLQAVADTLDLITHNSNNAGIWKQISLVTRSLLASVETIKSNKRECTEFLEQIYTLLHAIITVHIQSDMSEEWSPSILYNVAKFTE